MDSVTIFFRDAASEMVEAEAIALGLVLETGHVDGPEGVGCWFSRYEDWLTESDALERELVVARLGVSPRSAFALSCRHGKAAVFALQLAAQLMEKFAPAVIDDDRGGVWSSSDVRRAHDAGRVAGIFGLAANGA